MTDETFNGWTNRETWLVHLWLTNEEAAYHTALEIAKAADSDLRAGEAVRGWLSGDFSLNPAPWEIPENGLLADLINHSLSRVDWRSIGAAFREE